MKEEFTHNEILVLMRISQHLICNIVYKTSLLGRNCKYKTAFSKIEHSGKYYVMNENTPSVFCKGYYKGLL